MMQVIWSRTTDERLGFGQRHYKERMLILIPVLRIRKPYSELRNLDQVFTNITLHSICASAGTFNAIKICQLATVACMLFAISKNPTKIDLISRPPKFKRWEILESM